MDDNVTCRRSLVTNAFKPQAGIRTLRRPARSPNLNPNENVWSLLKRGVRRSIYPGDDLSWLEALLLKQTGMGGFQLSSYQQAPDLYAFTSVL